MSDLRRYFGWVARPQFLIGFVVICLCVGALGTIDRAASKRSLAITVGKPRVKGLHQTVSPVPDCAAVPCMALTFDDGPNTAITPRVLDILAQEQVKATFFVVGQRVAGREYLLRRMHNEGHEIGNHSWSHPPFIQIPPADMEMQLRITQQAITAAGVPAPHLFRPPYGAVDPTVMGHTRMAIIRWNVDPADWELKDAQQVKDHLVAMARPGGIVLLHDMYPSTADALGPALKELKPYYQFVTVSQLLNITPGDQGFYSGRQRQFSP